MALSDHSQSGDTGNIVQSTEQSQSGSNSILLDGNATDLEKSIELDQSDTDSPSEPLLSYEVYPGNRPSAGAVMRYQNLNNYYYALHYDAFDGGIAIGKIESGTVDLIYKGANLGIYRDSQWNSVDVQGFEDSTGAFVIRVSGSGSQISIRDPDNAFSGGGALGFAQGSNGVDGPDLADTGGPEDKIFFDDISYQY